MRFAITPPMTSITPVRRARRATPPVAGSFETPYCAAAALAVVVAVALGGAVASQVAAVGEAVTAPQLALTLA